MSASWYELKDPAITLWSDTSFYSERFEKSAAALIAVERALTADGLPDAGESLPEFLRLFQFVADASPEHFTRLWNDPVAYYWVRRAVHFLAAVRGAPMGHVELAYCADVTTAGPAGALRFHLRDFKRFAIALAIMSERAMIFVEPWMTTLPLSLPGTNLVISGKGSISITGTTGAQLDAIYQGNRISIPISPRADDSQVASRPFIEPCPSVALGDVRIPLNPALFNLPGIGLSPEWTEPDLGFQTLHRDGITEALSLVARFQPESSGQFEQALKVLALKPMREGSFSSLSSSELPGAFICSMPCDRYELAATLIHEFHHNRLFYIEESGAFFEAASQERQGPPDSEDSEDPIEGENHYSPWRDTLRPLHGLFHALYVYLPVFRFWSKVIREERLEGLRLAFAHDQLARIPFQLRIGVNQLRRHASFTAFGSSLFQQMAAETSAAEETSRELGISLHMPAVSLRATGNFRPVLDAANPRQLSIGETLRNHLEKVDRQGECAEERLLLDRAMVSDGRAAP